MNQQPDKPASLFAAREPIFPKRVKGKFRTLKWWIMLVTLGVYYITPWLRWDRGPNMPDQAVLIDLAHRRFFMFWIEIWPHEFYFVAGLLIMAGLGLFLFTSALGRVWCGYACPQTVWTDLFILVERWIEGDRNARIRLWKQKYDLRKWRLRLTKWVIWLLISVGTGGAWVFYFADAPTLLVDLFTGTAAMVAYASIAILTATTFVFGGFMREQICIYACPWPRIQAAMMDEETLTVGYREWRGEPRGKMNSSVETGDCIDCMACVNVCPVGIDIRDGQQMECITCALCIDACDDIMTKIGKPRGLIDYLALTDEPAERAGKAPRPIWQHVLRPRTIMYTGLWGAVGVGLLVALFIRSDLDIKVSPVRNPTFITLSDGTIRNVYDIRLRNMLTVDRELTLSVTGGDNLTAIIQGEDGLTVSAKPDEITALRVYLSSPSNSVTAHDPSTEVRFWLEDIATETRSHADTIFNGTGQN